VWGNGETVVWEMFASGFQVIFIHCLINSSILFCQDGRIAVKACEGLMLLVSLPEPAAAKCLTQSTCLCELLTDRLATLYRALPQSLDPLDIETVEAINWG